MYEFRSSDSSVLATFPLGKFRGSRRGLFSRGTGGAARQRRAEKPKKLLPRRGPNSISMGLPAFGETDLTSQLSFFSIDCLWRNQKRVFRFPRLNQMVLGEDISIFHWTSRAEETAGKVEI